MAVEFIPIDRDTPYILPPCVQDYRKRLANYVYLVLAGFAMMPSPSIDLSRANYDSELIQKSNQPPALV